MFWKVLVVLLAMAAVLFFGKTFTDSGMGWYATLTKPALTPPGIWFSIVWVTIYVLITICVIRVWHRKMPGYRVILTVFVIN